MDYQKNQELLFNLVKEKGVLKQDVFSNIILNFKILKSVLKEIGDELKDKMSEVDDRVIIEYKDSGEFELLWTILEPHSSIIKKLYSYILTIWCCDILCITKHT